MQQLEPPFAPSALGGIVQQWRVLPSQKVDCYDLDSVVKHFSKRVHDKLARKLLHQKNQGYGLKFVVKV